MSLPKETACTIEDIYALPDGQRAELIDGQMYMMAPPKRIHQKLLSNLHYKIYGYIDSKKGSCEVYPAPFAVFLNMDDCTYVEPDLCIICDRNKLTDDGCKGAPDWIIEIVSPSTERMDYGLKLFKYRSAGVREYWVVNPIKKTINVYDFEKDNLTGLYSFQDEIHSCTFPDLAILMETMTE